MATKPQFSFGISLSVLNHLGRNLYRSFTTVLGEAISNSWDADASNVWIHIDRDSNSFFIKDDGSGMDATDFQDKFLKIGYSKRKEATASSRNRPFIGRKGIGKLALLSCAEQITVISKVRGGEYVGGLIDNRGLDQAITDDLTPDEYPLDTVDMTAFASYIEGHDQGTIIRFQNTKDGIRNSSDFLKKTIALYFRFALLDDSFAIFLDGEKVTLDDLNDLAEKTEFLWSINGIEDPYIAEKLKKLKERKDMTVGTEFKGFIASVEKPRDLKAIGTAEKASIDLFVNGRMRERDILKHIPTARVVESYLYGQIHFDSLDDDIDRFTSSREGIVADDPKFEQFLGDFKTHVLTPILEEWDKWRRKHKKDGDIDNDAIPAKERKAGELFNAISGEYTLPAGSTNKQKVDAWVDALSGDASFNFASYAECFVSENLVRKFIADQGTVLSTEAQRDITEWKRKETQNKTNGNVMIDLRLNNDDKSYLDMAGLANLVDRTGSLSTDSRTYRPIRDALMHTALLTDKAKRRLTTVYDNIRARIIALLS
ncbi:MAG: ATP-binding protein [Patescibacteria group bacterium]|nr:ATP-binding protein [Patescibacteria group bacterium]